MAELKNINRSGTRVDAKIVQNSDSNYFKIVNIADVDWNEASMTLGTYTYTINETVDLLNLLESNITVSYWCTQEQYDALSDAVKSSNIEFNIYEE